MLWLAAFASLLGALVVWVSVALAATPPEFLVQLCSNGAGAGQCNNVRGVAADPSAPGHVYVSSSPNKRVEEFTSWGVFVKAFGWGVNQGAPSEELQTCTVATGCQAGKQGAGAGEFGQVTGAPNGIAVDSSGKVYVADNAFNSTRVQVFDSAGQFERMWGGGVVASGAMGTGTITDGSKTVSAANTTEGSFVPGQTVSGKDIPAGTTVTGVGNTTITLSKAAEGGECPAGCPAEPLEVAAGSGNVPVNEQWTLGVTASGGQYKLKFTAPKPQSVAIEQTTLELEYNATAAEIEEKLEELTNVGAGNVAVSEPGAGEYAIEFSGKYADTLLDNENLNAVPTLSVTGSTLTGGSATLSRTQRGAAAGEVCTVAADCGMAVSGAGPGQFGNWQTGAFVAVDSADRVYVGDKERIERFSPAGAWEADLGASILSGGGFVEGLVLDPAGQIYEISQNVGNTVRELSPDGTTLENTISVAEPQALATDSEGHVYVSSGASDPTIVEYDEGGSEVLTEFLGEGEFEASRAIATGSACLGAGSDFYAGNSKNNEGYVRAYGPLPECEPPPPLPPEIVEGSEQASGVGTMTATLEAKIDPNFWDTEYLVEYGPADCSANPCQTAPAPPAILSGEARGANPVSVGLTGLTPGATYHYRFVATSHCVAAEPAEECASEGADHVFATFLTPPGALPDNRGYEMASPAQKNSAEAGVPLVAGGETSGFSVKPIQASSTGEAVSYSSATSFAAPESAPSASQYRSTRGGSGWSTENLDPAFEDGFLRDPFVGFSRDLSHAAVIAIQPPLTPDASAGFPNIYRRDADGTLTALTTEAHQPELGPTSKEFYCLAYGGASADFDHVFFSAPGALIEGDPTAEGAFNLYEWDSQGANAKQELTVSATGGEYTLTATFAAGGAKHTETTQPIAATANAATVREALAALPSVGAGNVAVSGGPGDATGEHPYQIEFTGALADTYARFLGATDLSLSGGASEASLATVEVGGHLHLASVLPDGSAATPTNNSGFGRNGAQLNCDMEQSLLRHAVSADGSKAFWTYPGEYESFAEPPFTFVIQPLLARVEGSETVELDAAQPGSLAAEGFFSSGLGEYQDATPDGSRVFFTDFLPLTVDAGFEGFDHLYMYDFGQPEGEELSDLTPNGGESAEVQGVIGSSEAGDYVYFVATAVLAANQGAAIDPETGDPEEAEEGKDNLYLWHEGEGGPEIRFIARLEGPFSEDAWRAEPSFQKARVSPDGAQLAFVSTSSLTGYDNRIADGSAFCRTSVGGAPEGGPACSEAFVYRAQADQLACVSCNPSGARPLGPPAYLGETNVPTWSTPYEQSRYLADSGRVFFTSRDALSPRDANGNKQDIYQWEPAGVGGCTAASSSFSALTKGCVGLISTGESADDSYLLDASSSGNDVFFSTRQRLVWSDEDERFDVYDARVGGGFPEPSPPVSCEGEGCREAGTSAGPTASAGTSSFHGAGNLRPRRDCKPAARKAKKLRRRAKRLRRQAKQAKRAGKSHVAKQRSRKATRLAKQARRKSKSAKRCRRANRRAAR